MSTARQPEVTMFDTIFILATAAFFVASLAYVVGCEKL